MTKSEIREKNNVSWALFLNELQTAEINFEKLLGWTVNAIFFENFVGLKDLCHKIRPN